VPFEPGLPKLGHERVHARAGRASPLGHTRLRDRGKAAVRRLFLHIARYEQEHVGETVLRVIEKQINQVLLDADISGEHVGEKPPRERGLCQHLPPKLLLLDLHHGAGGDGGRGRHSLWLARKAALAKEVVPIEDRDGGLLAGVRDDREPHRALHDVQDRPRDVSLRENARASLVPDAMRLNARPVNFFGVHHSVPIRQRREHTGSDSDHVCSQASQDRWQVRGRGSGTSAPLRSGGEP
jgi:hypothetical protein